MVPAAEHAQTGTASVAPCRRAEKRFRRANPGGFGVGAPVFGSVRSRRIEDALRPAQLSGIGGANRDAGSTCRKARPTGTSCSRAERPARQQGLRNEHREPPLRTRTPNPSDRRQRQQASRHPPRPSNSPNARRRNRGTDRRTDPFSATMDTRSTAAPPTAGCAPSAGAPVSPALTRTCSERRSSWPRPTPASRYVTSRSLNATPTHEPPRSRPATPELRPTRRLRRRRRRHQRLTALRHSVLHHQ